MSAYYNEIEPYAAQWLRNLIQAGQIAPGEVDTRSIADVVPDDLRGFVQCHFFAGIGVWSYALRRAGWGDDRPVWTGSCPCQPFSAAGRGEGFADERHLWPAWHHLISQCRPSDILGEQVASKAFGPWLDLVQADLEGVGYAVGCVPFPSAGVGAPHLRDRGWFMARASSGGRRSWSGHDPSRQRCSELPSDDGLLPRQLGDACGNRDWQHPGKLCGDESEHGVGTAQRDHAPVNAGAAGLLADMHGDRRDQGRQREPEAGHDGAFGDGAARVLGLATGSGSQGLADGRGHVYGSGRTASERASGEFTGRMETRTRPGPTNGFWSDPDWLFCRDGRWRAVEPGTFPLAHGAPARVGRLRAYGNAINAEAAQAFIESVMDCRP